MRLPTFAVLAIVTCSSALQAQQSLDPEAVESFFDRAWAESISQDGLVPGAVVTIVTRDGFVLNKGYGQRDIASGKPVDPRNTRVRIGSTSKLFTVMTALSLVDEGMIDLDEDVNTYLTDVKVPDTYHDPVTLRTLLSHLSGFDSDIGGYMAPDNNGIGISAEEYQRRLRRVRPVNREYGYDNMGLGLMGYLAGVVNNSSFAQAVDQRVLQPLQLHNTAMGVPDRQLEHLGACHSWDDAGEQTPCRHKFMRTAFQGAGDISTTGEDMGRFMIALLNGGCLDSACLLQPETFERFTDMNMNRLHPKAKGMGFILYEKEFAGRAAIGHDGGQDGFSTMMSLFPEHGIGVFFSVFIYSGIPADHSLLVMMDSIKRGTLQNGYAAANKTTVEFAEQFLFASAVTPPQDNEFEPVNLGFLDGNYVDTRGIGASLLTRMMRVLGAVRVDAGADEVTIAEQGPYRQSDTGVLSKPGDELSWYFTRKDQDVFLQASSGFAVSMLVQKPWYVNPKIVLYPLLLPILLAPIGLLYGLLSRRASGRNLRRMVGLLVFFSGVALLAGLYLELEYFAREYYPNGASLGLILWRILLHLGFLAAMFTVVLIVTGEGVVNFKGAKAILVSALTVLFALSSLIVVLLLPYWKIIGNLTH